MLPPPSSGSIRRASSCARPSLERHALRRPALQIAVAAFCGALTHAARAEVCPAPGSAHVVDSALVSPCTLDVASESLVVRGAGDLSQINAPVVHVRDAGGTSILVEQGVVRLPDGGSLSTILVQAPLREGITVGGGAGAALVSAGNERTAINNQSSIADGIRVLTGGTVRGGLGAPPQSGASIANQIGAVIGGRHAIDVDGGRVEGPKIVNFGRIEGTPSDPTSTGIRITGDGFVTGTLQNGIPGVVSGGDAGISIVGQSRWSDSVLNFGTIRGGRHSIFVSDDSRLNNILIAGQDTALFDGAIHARLTPVTLVAGASYTAVESSRWEITQFSQRGRLTLPSSTTLTIEGNHDATAAGARLRIGVADDTTYGRLVVTAQSAPPAGGLADGGGTVRLPSNMPIDVDVTDPDRVFTVRRLPGVIVADRLVSDGTFRVTDNSTLFTYGAERNGNAVDLVLSGGNAGTNGTPGVSDAIGTNGNPAGGGAAAVLDNAINRDPTAPIAQPFVPLTTSQQVSNAVSQSLPLFDGGTQLATLSVVGNLTHIVQARVENNLGLSSGEMFAGDRVVWAKPVGSWGDQGERGNVAGWRTRAEGLLLGFDAVSTDTTRLGLALGYSRARIDGRSAVAPQSANVDVWQLIGYGSRTLAADTEASFLVGVGHNRTDGQRVITFANQVANSRYDSATFVAGAQVGRAFPLTGRLTLSPLARADYQWIRDDGYAETGAGALNLAVAGRSTDAFIVSAGAKADYAATDTLRLVANAAPGYDFINARAVITSTYAGAPGLPFVTPGLQPGAWLVRAGAGVVWKPLPRFEATLRYDVEARSEFTFQSASLKMRFEL
jgi:outer membrane autotransporter protein